VQILAVSGEKAVERKFPLAKDGIVFVDLWVLPTADPSASPLSTMDVNGAVLGFVKEGERGTVVAVTDAKTGASSATGHMFDIEENNLAVDWVRVTIRQDTKAKTWDLFLNNQLVLIDQPLDGAQKSVLLSFYPNSAGSAYIDDLTISETNPLFPDQDKDGIPDAVEETNGTNPYYNDRNVDANEDGRRNIENYLAGRPMTTSAAGNRRYVYIDSAAGNDAETGEFSTRGGGKGPKKSLRGAAAAAAKGGDVVFVLLPSDKPYVCPDYPKGKAPDVSYVLLGNATLTGE
jgi:hypothetical protein